MPRPGPDFVQGLDVAELQQSGFCGTVLEVQLLSEESLSHVQCSKMEREESVAKDAGQQAIYSLFLKEKLKEEKQKEMADSPVNLSQVSHH
ncbi:hypothetical protein U0070_025652, partial [Myodes glareolus]